MAEPNYEDVFKNLPGSYLVLEPSLRIVAASDAYLKATSSVRSELVGHFLFDVFPRNHEYPSVDAVRETRASIERVLQGRVADSLAVQRDDIRRPESEGGGFETQYWSSSNSPVLGADGSVTYIIHGVENVTEVVLLKEQAREQARLMQELRDRVDRSQTDLNARSAEVGEGARQLKLANEQLGRFYEQSLNEVGIQIFDKLSDELRTPLTLILGPLERLLDGPGLDPATRKALGGVQRSARTLQRHVGDLFDIATLNAGQLRLRYVSTDLGSLARRVASYFESVAAERSIHYEVNTPDVLSAEVDTEKIERMLLNVLSNAFKFTPDAGHIRLSLSEGNGRARIQIEDNGPGVPEPLRAIIFERFRQGRDAQAPAHGSTGLGLAIVREFTTLHHGSVSADAAPLGGALFTIELPLAAPIGAQMAEAASPDARSARQVVDELAQREIPSRELPIPSDVEAPHILIVHGHPDVSAFLAESLGRHYWISRASNGRDGVQKALMPDRPDLIIADVTMADMSGPEMVAELRRHGTLEDVPIVMLTAKADDALRLQLLREGIQDYLLKPFSVDELLARVQSLLARWKRTGQRLRQSEERYRTLFNSVDEGFCIIEIIFDDSDKAIDYLFLETNPSFEKQTGLVDVQGKRIRELVPDMEEHWLEIYGKVALTGEPVRFESHAQHLARWFDTYAFRYGDRENRQVAVLFADITERKRTEEALHEADRRKDQFLALLAHELRNPLAPIRNAVQILRMSPAANAPTSQLLPMMERQLAHMARLLDDLLDVSRIANGMIELRKERMDVLQAVQTAVEANKPLIDLKGHQMSMSLPPHPIMLDADPVRLAQVVSNLLNNAAHYSMPGGRIHLSVEPAGREVQVSVKDSGRGIRPDDLENIFGLFVQVGQPFTRREGGLGIGLSLVRTMVDLHGGWVHARSAGLGKGSEFIVRLPIAAEQVQEQTRSRAHAGSRS
jgi:PAS domain S-box-containing protein